VLANQQHCSLSSALAQLSAVLRHRLLCALQQTAAAFVALCAALHRRWSCWRSHPLSSLAQLATAGVQASQRALQAAADEQRVQCAASLTQQTAWRPFMCQVRSSTLSSLSSRLTSVCPLSPLLVLMLAEARARARR
jgi:hypothetical protein